MSTRGKRYRQASEGLSQDNFYPIDDALKLVKQSASAKFDETVDVSINWASMPRNQTRMSAALRYCRKGPAKQCA